MGLFDLLAPVLGAIDSVLSGFLPGGLRLALWGVLAGWLTMLLYRKLSRQEAISELKDRQKILQQEIAKFDGEMSELMPRIKEAFALGFKQLGLAIGPAILATIPILFIVVWVATQFVYQAPQAGEQVSATAEPERGNLIWSANASAELTEEGWQIQWPAEGEALTLSADSKPVLTLSDEELHGIIHKKVWWNALIGNPAGYLEEGSKVEAVHIALPERTYLGFGPGWMRGWMFLFFGTFLLASVAFKFLLRIA